MRAAPGWGRASGATEPRACEMRPRPAGMEPAVGRHASARRRDACARRRDACARRRDACARRGHASARRRRASAAYFREARRRSSTCGLSPRPRRDEPPGGARVARARGGLAKRRTPHSRTADRNHEPSRGRPGLREGHNSRWASFRIP
jgi:hypothetical protein